MHIERRSDGLIRIEQPSFNTETTTRGSTPEGLLFQIYSSREVITNIVNHFKMMNLRDHTHSQANVLTDFYNLRFRYASISRRISRATGYQDVIANQFTIFNVAGIGKMSHEIPAAINAIIANPVFDYLVIVIDADANNIHTNLTLIQNIVAAPTTPTLPANCNIEIIVQQVCIETWFIGHADAYVAAKACRDRGILQLMTEYDAQNNDPEMMPNNRSATVHSIGAYHNCLLKKNVKRSQSYLELWQINCRYTHRYSLCAAA